MIFHLGARQHFRLANLSMAALAVGLCAMMASIEPTRPTDEQSLDESVSPPTLSASGKVADRLDSAGQVPEDDYPIRSVAMLVSEFEFFAPTQEFSIGLQTLARVELKTPQLPPRSVAVSSQSKIAFGKDKLTRTVIPPTRPKGLEGVEPAVAMTAEAKAEPAIVLGLKLPRVVSNARTAIVRQVVAWGGTISQMAQGL